MEPDDDWEKLDHHKGKKDRHHENAERNLEEDEDAPEPVQNLKKTKHHRISQAIREKRGKNIIIQGIPERKDENLGNIFAQLLTKIHDPSVNANFPIARIGRLAKDAKKPRPVFVHLPTQRHRDTILEAVGTHNKCNPKDKLNSNHLGLRGPKEPVYVSEDLSPAQLALRAATRKKAREQNLESGGPSSN